jgi:hypothetical protein
MTKSMLDV